MDPVSTRMAALWGRIEHMKGGDKRSLFPEIDGMIHEPARLRILVLLANIEEADFMYILGQSGLSRGNLSVQMTRLDKQGYVELERRIEGSRARTSYRLSRNGREALAKYKEVMGTYLQALPESI